VDDFDENLRQITLAPSYPDRSYNFRKGNRSDYVFEQNIKSGHKIQTELIQNLIKKHKEDIEYFIRFNYKDKLTKENVYKRLKKENII